MLFQNLLTFSVLVLGLVELTDAAFYVCPVSFSAKYLPRDMNDVSDCVHQSVVDRKRLLMDNNNTFASFRCPENSSATKIGPNSFADCVCHKQFYRNDAHSSCDVLLKFCKGRYVAKKGVINPKSLADCDCHQPYDKDDSTGECLLKKCPRAGNYIAKKDIKVVSSLADCACISPYLKNDRSGECYIGYKCPAYSTPLSERSTKSFDDCHCNYGYIRDLKNKLCLVEKKNIYRCPPRSKSMSPETTKTTFADCVCEQGYHRNEIKQSCDNMSTIGKSQKYVFHCPKYSVPLSPFPYNMKQCVCLPGFTPDLTLEMCFWNPDSYKCPNHSYRKHHQLRELEFSDCNCAAGYVRDEMDQKCLKPKGPFECPESSIISNWPVVNMSDCQCIHRMIHENSASSVNGKKELTCPPILSEKDYELKECPEHSLVNSWPMTNRSTDCSCVNGYIRNRHVSRSNNSFCVKSARSNCPTRSVERNGHKPSTYHKCKCFKGLSMDHYTQSCRFPFEEVYKTKGNKEGKIVIDGSELNYVVAEDDIMVTQGDVAVGTTFGFNTAAIPLHFYILHGYYNQEKDHRWKDATACYSLDSGISHKKADIQSAMHHISVNTGFTFVECKTKSCSNEVKMKCVDFLHFKETKVSCFSFIGRIGGSQRIGVSSDCQFGNLVHVLLHAIGLHHPSARPDRSDHISVNWDCIPSQKRSFFVSESRNFSKIPLSIPYDFFSIMHPPADAFVSDSKKWCRSVISRIANENQREKVNREMGQREKMSLLDIHYVWAIYPHLKSRSHTQNLNKHKELHHASHFHVKKPIASTRRVSATKNTSKFTSYLGASLCIFGLLGVLLFLYKEHQRQSKDKDDIDDIYADPLICDSMYE